MSDFPTQGRGEQGDVQSVQSLTMQNPTAQYQTQQRSSSQAERSERSEISGGRSERQRIQRSSSSTSSSSGAGGQRTSGGRPPAGANIIGTTTTGYQINAADATFAQGTSVGSLGSVASGERRPGRHRRQVIRLPDQAQGQVRQVRRRLPTPEPDTLERVYIQRTAGEIVEEITEIPTTPPPRIQERTVVEPAGPAQVVKRVIRVPPRGNYGNYQQQQQQQQQQGNFQFSSEASVAGSFGNIQQAASAFQQDPNVGANYQHYSTGVSAAGSPAAVPSGASYATGYSQVDGNYGAVNTGYQPAQQGYNYGANTGGYSSQGVLPPAGCHPAFCFYV